jgi:DNA repair exonuclease SbcCD ATPase subunit
VALNTYTAPFLSLKANEQRTIIEQLLGITLLSDKADALKERSRGTKESIQTEELRIRAVTDANRRIEEQIAALKRRQSLWITKHNEEVDQLGVAYDQLNQIDIDEELAAHRALDLYNKKTKDLADLTKAIKRAELDLAREEKSGSTLVTEITSLKNHTCHSCGQSWHNDQQDLQLKDKQHLLELCGEHIVEYRAQIHELTAAITDIGNAGAQPQVFYDKESDAIEHRSTLANLKSNLERKLQDQDPYAEQIEDMTKTALEEISYDVLNELTKVRDHEEFLLKLLTNKDSFIRKKIIDQNLSYLNTRLSYYLEKIGLPHQVSFQNDLSVSITELGRDMDFDNLSRGERNRLILSLSWAFRDVWENLYQKINLLFVDELVDSGLDASGMEGSLAILKKISRDSKKSVWLVSHRDELVARVENILKVTKSNGFTTYSTDSES